MITSSGLVPKADADVCDDCGKHAIGTAGFAQAFRFRAASENLPNPGNICGACAAKLEVALLFGGINYTVSNFASYLDHKYWRRYA